MAKYTLPELRYDYGALEPHVSAHHGAAPRQAPRRLRQGRQHGAREARRGARQGRLRRLAASSARWPSTCRATCCTRCSGQNLAPEAGGEPDGRAGRRDHDDFGGFDAFKQQLTGSASTVMGSGWAALVVGARRAAAAHHADLRPPVATSRRGTPIMVLDAWEHAYYLQYENRKAEFFEAIWNVGTGPTWAGASRRRARSTSSWSGPEPRSDRPARPGLASVGAHPVRP